MPVSIRQTYQGRLQTSKSALDRVKKTIVSFWALHCRLRLISSATYDPRTSATTYCPVLECPIPTTRTPTNLPLFHRERVCCRGPNVSRTVRSDCRMLRESLSRRKMSVRTS